MKKVVILSAFLSPLRSGAEACSEEVPLALSDQFDFMIITAKMQRDLPRRDLLQGKIPVIRVGLGLGIDKWLFPFLAPFVVRSKHPDVIHAVLETFAGLALLWCGFLCKDAKRILTCQTTNRSFLKGIIVRSPDTVTVISSALVGICNTLGCHEVIRIPNGIDLASLLEARKTVSTVPGRILFVGRLEAMKGIDTLIHAFAHVVKKHPTVTLRIVGHGSEQHRLHALAESLSVSDSVFFTGRIEPARIAQEYAAAEIFCGLSRREALGNVFLEAQAAGCAVVATHVDGIPDIVEDSVSGLLIEPDNVDEAVLALVTVIENNDLKVRLQQGGMHSASQYDWGEIAQQYAKLY